MVNSKSKKYTIEIEKMVEKDQDARKKYIDSGGVGVKLSDIDKRNENRLIEILGKIGIQIIPTKAVIIVLHSDSVKLMERYISLMNKAHVLGIKISFQNYASLYDRIQVLKGKKQKFGTQFIINKKSKKLSFATPIQNYTQTKRLRKKFKMPTLKKYTSDLHKTYRKFINS